MKTEVPAEVIEWAAQLGAGLILCCWGKYEDALRNFIRCHQSALFLDRGKSQCRVDVAARSICEAVQAIGMSQGYDKAYELMLPLFVRNEIEARSARSVRITPFKFPGASSFLQSYSDSAPIASSGFISCSDLAQAWSAFFVGSTLIEFGDEWGSPYSARRWLGCCTWDMPEVGAAGPYNINRLWHYIECAANSLLFELTDYGDDHCNVDHLHARTAAAKRWGHMDEQVSALYQSFFHLMRRTKFGEAIECRNELTDLLKNSTDPFFQSVNAGLSGIIACTSGQCKDGADLATQALTGLEFPKIEAPWPWTLFYGQCATLGFKTCWSPSRTRWSIRCVHNWCQVIIHSPKSTLCQARIAEEKFRWVMNPGPHILDTITKQNIWDTRGEIYIQLCENQVKEKVPLDWYDKAESYMAEALRESKTDADMGRTLLNMVKLVEVFMCKKCCCFYSQDVKNIGRFEMIDSFLEEAENKIEQVNYGFILQRGMYLCRMWRMGEAIDKLETYVKLTQKPSFVGTISHSNNWIFFYENFSICYELLQVALISCGEWDRALIWAERERAQDMLHSIRTNWSAADPSVNPELINDEQTLEDPELNDEQTLEEMKSISKDAGLDTAFLVYTTVRGCLGICALLVHNGETLYGWHHRLHRCSSVQSLVQYAVLRLRDNKMDEIRKWYNVLIAPFEERLEEINPKSS